MSAMDVKWIAPALAGDANDADRDPAGEIRGNNSFGFPDYLPEEPSHRFRPNSNQADQRLPSASV
jgi:hypothetical protein